jgi:hypothetical protein
MDESPAIAQVGGSLGRVAASGPHRRLAFAVHAEKQASK